MYIMQLKKIWNKAFTFETIISIFFSISVFMYVENAKS